MPRKFETFSEQLASRGRSSVGNATTDKIIMRREAGGGNPKTGGNEEIGITETQDDERVNSGKCGEVGITGMYK